MISYAPEPFERIVKAAPDPLPLVTFDETELNVLLPAASPEICALAIAPTCFVS